MEFGLLTTRGKIVVKQVYSYTVANLTAVADTISLRCHQRLDVRSRVELAIACSKEDLCRAIRTDEWGTSSSFCACPKQITWPRTGIHLTGTMNLRLFSEPLPGKFSWFTFGTDFRNYLLLHHKSNAFAKLCNMQCWKKIVTPLMFSFLCT